MILFELLFQKYHCFIFNSKKRDRIGFTMARRRTRKDKIIAQLRRQVDHQQTDEDIELSYKLSSDKTVQKKPQPTTKINKASSDSSSLFSYNPKLIKKDLLRTAFLVIFAFFIEIGLFFFWKQ